MIELLRRKPEAHAGTALSTEQKVAILLASPAMIQAEADHAAVILQQRIDAAATINDTGDAAARESRDFHDAARENVARLSELREQFRAAEIEHMQLCAAWNTRSDALERARSAAERSLIATADPAIDRFIARAWELLTERHAARAGAAGDAWRAGMRGAILTAET